MQTRFKPQTSIIPKPLPAVRADPLVVDLCTALMQHHVTPHIWHTSPEVELARARMRNHVLQLITQGKPVASRQATEGLRHVANAVEGGLFSAATSLPE
ncbi:hypothetical protein EON65_45095 [archaeon]|nr:MAG: hypothetical protein EON65_45095 [archaeon]